MGAKIRISEQKTKIFLSFLALGSPLATIGTQEREYLRAKLKDSANRAENQI